ncbi:hypothetical protein V5799_013423 [Amblyomma americanum]|uniref:Uncharacterized protein n=1 Tax=Amblyomma americanum TaxID=6943 RepID=A0AAQ4E5Y6_AMBAM
MPRLSDTKMMPQGKQPSSVASQKTAAVRSRTLPYVPANRKTGPVVPMATKTGPASALGQPGQTTTCIAYAFQASKGQEAILLIPTTAFKVELREQAGQKVLQLLPPATPFVPFVKAANRPAAAAASIGTSHQGFAGTSQQTTAASSSAASDKPSTATSATLKTTTPRFQTCPSSWANALRLDVGGKVVNGKCATLPSGGKMKLAKAAPVGGEQAREQMKQAAAVRYSRNEALMGEVLDDRPVRVRDEVAGMSDSSGRERHLRWLTSKVLSAMMDVEQMQSARKQKMNEIAEAEGLFRYKMDRFMEVASFVNSAEFHKAEVEAELHRMSGMNSS